MRANTQKNTQQQINVVAGKKWPYGLFTLYKCPAQYKKNGLYDWKMVVVDQRTSTNIHTQNIHTQPNSTSKLISIPQQNIYFKNWLVAPNRKVGGDGLKSYILEVNTSANSAKIGKNNSFENIHTCGFNKPGPEGKSPAKLTVLAENESKP